MLQEKRFAVLIDADNVSAKYIKYILEEVSNSGVATYKRIYGDWTKPNASSWKDVLLEYSVTPIQQYSYTVGKNATDSAMIIDAMDILYSGNVEGFCIVSSDSDFTKLSSRLRESGMLVLGMGERKTPKPFIASCNQFKFLDLIAETEKKSIETKTNKDIENDKVDNIRSEGSLEITSNQELEKSEAPKNMTDISTIKSAIIKIMNEADNDDQNMHMGELGSKLVKRYPDFDVRNYGDTKLSKFLKKFDFLEISTKSDGGGTSMWVSLKTNNSNTNNITVKNIKTNSQKKRKKYYRKNKKH
ncbi:MAG: NYN domain-containing protein [Tissierellia bacterium]|nr:NYN domain-containing protein [Tissierellia bacterium]